MIEEKIIEEEAYKETNFIMHKKALRLLQVLIG